MNKDRFNQLLGNLNQVTNEDIKSLNELRKKYPFFQTPYVIVAKALKDLDHPKTSAFIKKAAIYSPDRAHLKKIITGEIQFDSVKIASKKEEEPPISKSRETIDASNIPGLEEKEEQLETTEAELNPAPNQKSTIETDSQLSAEKLEAKEETVSKKPTKSTSFSGKTDQIDQLEKDLIEIRERKLKLAKFFDQQGENEEAKKLKVKKSNVSQVELIEKFIQNEPQFDKKLGAQLDSEYEQEDLSSKKMKHSDEFSTETLAELYYQQKKYKKAVNIYEKLSLKFPEKRTYFAAQIQKIKEVQHV